VHDGRGAIDESFGEHHARIGDCMNDGKIDHHLEGRANGLYHGDYRDHRHPAQEEKMNLGA
jgi:hypothetical protein